MFDALFRYSSESGSGTSERLKVPAITTTVPSSSSTNRTSTAGADFMLEDLDLDGVVGSQKKRRNIRTQPPRSPSKVRS